MQTYSLLGIFLRSFYFVEKVVRHFAQMLLQLSFTQTIQLAISFVI